jgi:hypothetical protein
MRKQLLALLVLASLGGPLYAGQWVYTDHADKMQGINTKTGSLKSEVPLQFKPPYSGKNSAWISVSSLPSGDYGVSIWVEKGQILCPRECEVMAKFDGSSIMAFKASHPIDLSQNRINISKGGLFFDWMSKSKDVMVQVTMYQDGMQVLEFKIPEPPKVD